MESEAIKCVEYKSQEKYDTTKVTGFGENILYPSSVRLETAAGTQIFLCSGLFLFHLAEKIGSAGSSSALKYCTFPRRFVIFGSMYGRASGFSQFSYRSYHKYSSSFPFQLLYLRKVIKV